MAYPEMIMEREAYMADTEIENMQLRDDLDKASGSYWWKKWQAVNDTVQDWMNKWRNAEDRVMMLERKLTDSQKQLQRMESLMRDHLDECEPEDDDDYESQARQILRHASDIEKQIQSEGYDDTDSEHVPF